MNILKVVTIKYALLPVIVIVNLSCGGDAIEKGTTTAKLCDYSSTETEINDHSFIETLRTAGVLDAS